MGFDVFFDKHISSGPCDQWQYIYYLFYFTEKSLKIMQKSAEKGTMDQWVGVLGGEVGPSGPVPHPHTTAH